MLVAACIVSLLGVFTYYLSVRLTSNKTGSTLGSGLMFDSIAPYYDSANKIMSLGLDQSWRKSLVDALDLRTNDLVLDISTGTGDVAIWLAKKFQLLGKTDGQPITGLDPSSKMLSYAAAKISGGGLDKLIKLIEGNAESMDKLKNDYYDKVTMSFGIRNVPDRLKALREIYRVMRPDGKLIIMEFSTPSSGYLAPLSRFFLQYFVPIAGSLVSGGRTAEYDHLRDSILNFPSPTGFKEMITESGFSDCTNVDLFLDAVYLYICHKVVPKVIFTKAESIDMVQSVL